MTMLDKELLLIAIKIDSCDSLFKNYNKFSKKLLKNIKLWTEEDKNTFDLLWIFSFNCFFFFLIETSLQKNI